MARLPKPFSQASSVISSAISEGRAEEAIQKLIYALRADPDDRAVRQLASEWIERIGLPPGSAKSLRNGKPTLPEDWLQISEMVKQSQDDGLIYAAAVSYAADYFGCSVRHVQKCVAEWNEAADSGLD